MSNDRIGFARQQVKYRLAVGGLAALKLPLVVTAVLLASCGWVVCDAFSQSRPHNDAKNPSLPPLTELPDRGNSPLPSRAVARLGTLRLRDSKDISSVAFSPDGKLLASASYLGRISLWDRATGKVYFLLGEDYPYALSLISFSKDGKKLVAAGSSNKICLWSMPLGEKIIPKDPEIGYGAWALSMSPDGKLLAVGADRYLNVYDADSGQVRFSVKGTEPYGHSSFNAVAFSPDGKMLAFAEGTPWQEAPGDVDIRLCEADTGKVLRKLKGHKGKVWSLAFSPDGKMLAAASRDDPIRLWDVGEGKIVRELPFNNCYNLAFSPDGTKLATIGYGVHEGIRFWNPSTGKELTPIKNCGFGRRQITFSPDSKTLAMAGNSHAIRLWDVETREELPQFAGHFSPVLSIVFSPDGKTLASRSSDTTMRLWDLGSGKTKQVLYYDEYRGGRWEHSGDSTCTMAFSADGNRLIALGGEERSPEDAFFTWDIHSGDRVAKYPAQIYGWTSSVAVAPDGDAAATTRRFGVHLWSLASRKKAKDFIRLPAKSLGRSEPTDNERCAVFSPDGRTLAASSYFDHVVRLWDWKSRALLREIPVEGKFLDCLAFSPDGQLLVGCNPGPVCVWETAAGKLLRKFGEARQGGARSVAFAPDGRRIIVATKKSVDVWDVFTGEELSARDGHPLIAGGHLGDILCAAISPDGKTIASGSADTTILLWNAADLLPKTPVADLGPKDLDRLWDDLRSDAPTAYKAILALLGAPEKAIALIKERVPPAQKPDRKRIQALIADLDDNVVFVREAASKELGRLGEAVEPALRATLAGKPSSEVRSRCERLLESLAKGELDADGLRNLRAVQVLEQIGTPEASAVLKGLAGGAPGRLSREAKLALEVLNRRTP
jgi:WD40 repeat protein